MSEAPERESKTEEPTEKRIMDALKKGNAPISRELPVLLTMSAIWFAFSFLASGAAGEIAVSLRPFLAQPGAWSLGTAGDAALLVRYVAGYSALALAPIVGLIALAGMLGALPQSRGLVLERIKPKLSHISIGAGWKRIFGASGLANAGKTALKLVFVGAICGWSLYSVLASVTRSSDMLAGAMTSELSRMSAGLVGAVLAGFVLVVMLDVAMSYMTWWRGLRMTRQEVKDEAKESDGDPLVKLRMRQIARQRLRKRMMAAVPKATVVIANPTHYSVALRYVREEGGAPLVVAKGRDLIALRIREVAEQAGVPVVEDRMLARSLHDAVTVDQFIPPHFYKAVARIIHFLSSRSNQVAGRH